MNNKKILKLSNPEFIILNNNINNETIQQNELGEEDNENLLVQNISNDDERFNKSIATLFNNNTDSSNKIVKNRLSEIQKGHINQVMDCIRDYFDIEGKFIQNKHLVDILMNSIISNKDADNVDIKEIIQSILSSIDNNNIINDIKEYLLKKKIDIKNTNDENFKKLIKFSLKKTIQAFVYKTVNSYNDTDKKFVLKGSQLENLYSLLKFTSNLYSKEYDKISSDKDNLQEQEKLSYQVLLKKLPKEYRKNMNANNFLNLDSYENITKLIPNKLGIDKGDYKTQGLINEVNYTYKDAINDCKGLLKRNKQLSNTEEIRIKERLKFLMDKNNNDDKLSKEFEEFYKDKEKTKIIDAIFGYLNNFRRDVKVIDTMFSVYNEEQERIQHSGKSDDEKNKLIAKLKFNLIRNEYIKEYLDKNKEIKDGIISGNKVFLCFTALSLGSTVAMGGSIATSVLWRAGNLTLRETIKKFGGEVLEQLKRSFERANIYAKQMYEKSEVAKKIAKDLSDAYERLKLKYFDAISKAQSALDEAKKVADDKKLEVEKKREELTKAQDSLKEAQGSVTTKTLEMQEKQKEVEDATRAYKDAQATLELAATYDDKLVAHNNAVATFETIQNEFNAMSNSATEIIDANLPEDLGYGNMNWYERYLIITDIEGHFRYPDNSKLSKIYSEYKNQYNLNDVLADLDKQFGEKLGDYVDAKASERATMDELLVALKAQESAENIDLNELLDIKKQTEFELQTLEVDVNKAKDLAKEAQDLEDSIANALKDAEDAVTKAEDAVTKAENTLNSANTALENAEQNPESDLAKANNDLIDANETATNATQTANAAKDTAVNKGLKVAEAEIRLDEAEATEIGRKENFCNFGIPSSIVTVATIVGAVVAGFYIYNRRKSNKKGLISEDEVKKSIVESLEKAGILNSQKHKWFSENFIKDFSGRLLTEYNINKLNIYTGEDRNGTFLNKNTPMYQNTRKNSGSLFGVDNFELIMRAYTNSINNLNRQEERQKKSTEQIINEIKDKFRDTSYVFDDQFKRLYNKYDKHSIFEIDKNGVIIFRTGGKYNNRDRVNEGFNYNYFTTEEMYDDILKLEDIRRKNKTNKYLSKLAKSYLEYQTENSNDIKRNNYVKNTDTELVDMFNGLEESEINTNSNSIHFFNSNEKEFKCEKNTFYFDYKSKMIYFYDELNNFIKVGTFDKSTPDSKKVLTLFDGIDITGKGLNKALFRFVKLDKLRNITKKNNYATNIIDINKEDDLKKALNNWCKEYQETDMKLQLDHKKDEDLYKYLHNTKEKELQEQFMLTLNTEFNEEQQEEFKQRFQEFLGLGGSTMPISKIIKKNNLIDYYFEKHKDSDEDIVIKVIKNTYKKAQQDKHNNISSEEQLNLEDSITRNKIILNNTIEEDDKEDIKEEEIDYQNNKNKIKDKLNLLNNFVKGCDDKKIQEWFIEKITSFGEKDFIKCRNILYKFDGSNKTRQSLQNILNKQLLIDYINESKINEDDIVIRVINNIYQQQKKDCNIINTINITRKPLLKTKVNGNVFKEHNNNIENTENSSNIFNNKKIYLTKEEQEKEESKKKEKYINISNKIDNITKDIEKIKQKDNGNIVMHNNFIQ